MKLFKQKIITAFFCSLLLTAGCKPNDAGVDDLTLLLMAAPFLYGTTGTGTGTSNCINRYPVYTLNEIDSKTTGGARMTITVNIAKCGLYDHRDKLYFSPNGIVIPDSSIFVEELTIPGETIGAKSYTITVPTTLNIGSYYYLGFYYGYEAISPNQTKVVTAVANCAAPCNLNLSWTANKERAVNRTGGGYKIYYDTISGGSANVKEVPYVSGSTAPTATTLTLNTAELWYIRIIAYSNLNTTGSEASDEQSVLVYQE